MFYELRILVQTEEEALDLLSHVENGREEELYDISLMTTREVSRRDLMEEVGFRFRE